MNVTVVLLAVLLVSFVVGRVVDSYASRYVTPSGAEYLLFGILMGPELGFGLVTTDQLALLQPLIALVLGLLGFLVGIRAKDLLVNLDQAVAGVFAAAFIIGVVAFTTATVMPPLGLAMAGEPALFVIQVARAGDYVLELTVTASLLHVSLSLGAAAAVTSTAVNERVRQRLQAHGPIAQITQSMAAAASVTSVLVFGLVLAAVRAETAASGFGLGVTEWGLAVTVLSAGCGVLFRMFIGSETTTSRIFLAAVGSVIFASGVGSALGVSPMFVNLLAGLVIALTTQHTDRLRSELDRVQTPLFVLLMVLAGATWKPPGSLVVWGLVALLIPFRLLVWRVGSRVGTSLVLDSAPRVSRLGNAFLGQGVLAVAIAVFAAQRFPAYEGLVSTAVLASVLASDLFSEAFARRVLLDAGEGRADASLEQLEVEVASSQRAHGSPQKQPNPPPSTAGRPPVEGPELEIGPPIDLDSLGELADVLAEHDELELEQSGANAEEREDAGPMTQASSRFLSAADTAGSAEESAASSAAGGSDERDGAGRPEAAAPRKMGEDA